MGRPINGIHERMVPRDTRILGNLLSWRGWTLETGHVQRTTLSINQTFWDQNTLSSKALMTLALVKLNGVTLL